jgi:hypothetical protein
MMKAHLPLPERVTRLSDFFLWPMNRRSTASHSCDFNVRIDSVSGIKNRTSVLWSRSRAPRPCGYLRMLEIVPCSRATDGLQLTPLERRL